MQKSQKSPTRIRVEPLLFIYYYFILEATATLGQTACLLVVGKLLQEATQRDWTGQAMCTRSTGGGRNVLLHVESGRSTIRRWCDARDDLPAVTKTVKYAHPFSAFWRGCVTRTPACGSVACRRAMPTIIRSVTDQVALAAPISSTRTCRSAPCRHPSAHTGCQSDKDAAAANDPCRPRRNHRSRVNLQNGKKTVYLETSVVATSPTVLRAI